MVVQKIHSLKTEYVRDVPEMLEEGVIYVSNTFKTAIHLCPCGCGEEVVTPFGKWHLRDNDGYISIRPSIGNFSGEKPHHAHYYVTNGIVEWL